MPIKTQCMWSRVVQWKHGGPMHNPEVNGSKLSSAIASFFSRYILSDLFTDCCIRVVNIFLQDELQYYILKTQAQCGAEWCSGSMLGP